MGLATRKTTLAMVLDQASHTIELFQPAPSIMFPQPAGISGPAWNNPETSCLECLSQAQRAICPPWIKGSPQQGGWQPVAQEGKNGCKVAKDTHLSGLENLIPRVTI